MMLPTTLLRHDAPAGYAPPHYDWLILDPRARRDPALGLWTVRASVPWHEWAQRGRVDLVPLPRHRRRYLRWQGNLTDQRGRVRQAGVGHVHVHLWTPGRIELSLYPHPHQNPLHLSLQPQGSRWRATVIGG